jgi:hypothetical protein
MLTFIGTWFGYVGMCMVAPDASCRPFLAFLALGVAAAVALTLVLLAYKSAQARELDRIEKRVRTRALGTRVEPALGGKNAVTREAPRRHGDLHVAV